MPSYVWGVFALPFLSHAVAGYATGSLEVLWSPYQKLEIFSSDDFVGGYSIEVNNAGYQWISNLTRENLDRHPDKFKLERRGYGGNDLPYRFAPEAKSSLIVGAGTGNDVAAAIRSNISRILAVEIDPEIVELGRRYHPEKPYESSSVQVVVSDARAVFNTTAEKFDVVVFGLLDSHTTSGRTSQRLDSFVYTKESLERAKALLSESGILFLKFATPERYIHHRLFNLVLEVFGEQPLVLSLPRTAGDVGGVVFLSGSKSTIENALRNNSELRQIAEQMSFSPSIDLNVPLTTDDWPYLYLEYPKIPLVFGLFGIILIGLYFFNAKRSRADIKLFPFSTEDAHFFFLGAAFLLFEVQNISKASLILGNTWEVNAMIIFSIMMLILLANFLVSKFPKIPTLPCFLLLLASIACLYFTDLSSISIEDAMLRAFTVTFLVTSPLFLSGICFIRAFEQSERRDRAYGVNMFGSLVGGLLEFFSFLFGIKFLLVLVFCLYSFALLSRPR